MTSTTTATPTKPLSATDLLALIRLPLDAAPEVAPLVKAAEEAARIKADLGERERHYQTLWNPHYRQTLGRDADRTEMLDAATTRPTTAELALAESAALTATQRVEHAREAERQRRLYLLHQLRRTELPALSADYKKLVDRYAGLLAAEQACHENWPSRVTDRYALLVSNERLEAWRAAAATEGIDV